MGDVQVAAGHIVGLQGVDVVVVVIQLHRRERQGADDLLDAVLGLVRQKRLTQVFSGGEVVDGRTVEQDSGAVHGHVCGHPLESRLGPSRGYGEDAALTHEVADGLLIGVGHRRHGLAQPQRFLGVGQSVVIVTGQQQTGKFSHGDQTSEPEVGLLPPLPLRRRPPR